MSPTRAAYAAELAALPEEGWADYLSARSGLPGPRANLTLLDAAADVMPHDLALRLVDEADEYLACCGVATLGRLIVEDPAACGLVGLLTTRCSDERWRVREACAIAAQRIGDADAPLLRGIVEAWTSSSDPLVVRAGIAAICEPRLLKDSRTAAAALVACRRATEHLLSVPADGRRAADIRTLRQALGYCWSVAVAAAPDSGLAAFAELPTEDADVDWIVRENRKKKRLAGLLGVAP
ncbi:MAG: HEAT repeat domain-containing protein [Propionicimonas sp.]|uniref:HEAT repeat domain-containing protein n=1 Tax=Propionicimonas sp. TaxID=1955623 RepID=UPI003D0BD57C